jgi:transmembrane sensor
MEPNQFWSLLARKLAGEASLRDLYELEKLVFENPELRFWQRLVRELWNNRDDIEREPGGEKKFLQLLHDAYEQQYLRSKPKVPKKKNRCCIF